MNEPPNIYRKPTRQRCSTFPHHLLAPGQGRALPTPVYIGSLPRWRRSALLAAVEAATRAC